MAANPGTSHGFIFAESAALKHRLLSTFATDKTANEKAVQVFYRWPEGNTEKHFPFITIDLVDIAYAPDRQESEREYRYYVNDPTGPRSNKHYFIDTMDQDDLAAHAAGSSDGYLVEDQVVPVDLIFQVTTHARNPINDIQLTTLLLWRVFPMRRGFIEIPEDGTQRRCDLLDWRPINVLDQEAAYNKSIFRKAFTVSINSEIPQSELNRALEVLEVHGTLNGYHLVTDDNPIISEEI